MPRLAKMSQEEFIELINHVNSIDFEIKRLQRKKQTTINEVGYTVSMYNLKKHILKQKGLIPNVRIVK
jgi:hypothetical protein